MLANRVLDPRRSAAGSITLFFRLHADVEARKLFCALGFDCLKLLGIEA